MGASSPRANPPTSPAILMSCANTLANATPRASRRRKREAMLRVETVDVAYGDTQVLWDVSLEVSDGEVVALLGSNGAGKSTLLGTISGLLLPRRGRIVYDGDDIAGISPEKLVRRGISHVPQGRRLF